MRSFTEFMNIVDDPEDKRTYIQKVSRYIEDLKSSDVEDCKDLLLVLKKLLDMKLSGI